MNLDYDDDLDRLSVRDRVMFAWDNAALRWLVAVVAIAVLVVGFLVMRNQPTQVALTPTVSNSGRPVGGLPASVGPTASGAGMGGASADGARESGAPAGSASGGSGDVVTVHVVGPVHSPGVVRLPTGSRVADAVAAAGGATRAKVRINLARVLVDGEQIDVGSRPATPGSVAAGSSASGSAPNNQAGATGGTPGAKISLNQATAVQLEELPRVGPVLAAKIIEFRDTYGGFRSIEQLREVSGIGDVTFDQIVPHVTL